MDDKEGPPSAKAIDEGYNQTYLIMASAKSDGESKTDDNHEVFFRCGNWCYKGTIQFGGVEVNTEELPILIPLLQKQQGSLRYYCNAKSVPPTSDYTEPLKFLEDASEFIAQELLSESVDKELRKMASVFPWIDDDNSSTYFELALSIVPAYMSKVKMIASKTYTRGLILISIYSEGTIYFIMQPGEGDQALLDVRFPDVSQHGQGLHIDTYNNHTTPYRKLTLWHVLGTSASKKLPKDLPKIRTINVSTKNYQQTYCILKSSWDNNSPTLTVHHDVLFRFGSWCYSGRVQLTPSLSLADIPFVIPALRMQQSRLDYLCDVNQVPTTSPFAPALAYVQHITPLVEEQIIDSEKTLQDLIDRLTGMGLGDSVSKWLEGDPQNSFFEFKIVPDEAISETFKNVELIVSKCYYASGIIAITIIYQFTVYVSLLDNNGESPLLDSRFPDVSGKGRGYQLQAYNDGDREDWPTLRKVSIWQTVNALEQEFREKADALAQSKAASTSSMPQDAVKEGSGVTQTGDNTGSKAVSASYTEREEEGEDELVVVNTRRPVSGGADHKRSEEGARRLLTSGEPETEVPRAEAKNGPSSSSSSSTTMTTSSAKAQPVDRAVSSLSASMGATSLNGANNSTSNPSVGKGLSPLKPLGGGIRQALPHHIPKLDSLANKMDDIRKNMGDEGLKAPWDSKGRPLGGISTLGKDSKK